MEQLIKIKDSKIQSLVSKLQQAGIAWNVGDKMLMEMPVFLLYYYLNKLYENLFNIGFLQ